MQGKDLQGSVDSAVAEEYGDGGNTGRLLQRSTHADTLRTLTGIKDNYQRQSDEIDLNKETKLMETQQFTSNLHPPKAPSMLSNMLNVGLAGLQGYMQFKGSQNAQLINGLRESIAGASTNYSRPYEKDMNNVNFDYKKKTDYGSIFSREVGMNYAKGMKEYLSYNPSYGSRMKIIRR